MVPAAHEQQVHLVVVSGARGLFAMSDVSTHPGAPYMTARLGQRATVSDRPMRSQRDRPSGSTSDRPSGSPGQVHRRRGASWTTLARCQRGGRRCIGLRSSYGCTAGGNGRGRSRDCWAWAQTPSGGRGGAAQLPVARLLGLRSVQLAPNGPSSSASTRPCGSTRTPTRSPSTGCTCGARTARWSPMRLRLPPPPTWRTSLGVPPSGYAGSLRRVKRRAKTTSRRVGRCAARPRHEGLSLFGERAGPFTRAPATVLADGAVVAVRAAR